MTFCEPIAGRKELLLNSGKDESGKYVSYLYYE